MGKVWTVRAPHSSGIVGAAGVAYGDGVMESTLAFSGSVWRESNSSGEEAYQFKEVWRDAVFYPGRRDMCDHRVLRVMLYDGSPSRSYFVLLQDRDPLIMHAPQLSEGVMPDVPVRDDSRWVRGSFPNGRFVGEDEQSGTCVIVRGLGDPSFDSDGESVPSCAAVTATETVTSPPALAPVVAASGMSPGPASDIVPPTASNDLSVALPASLTEDPSVESHAFVGQNPAAAEESSTERPPVVCESRQRALDAAELALWHVTDR